MALHWAHIILPSSLHPSPHYDVFQIRTWITPERKYVSTPAQFQLISYCNVDCTSPYHSIMTYLFASHGNDDVLHLKFTRFLILLQILSYARWDCLYENNSRAAKSIFFSQTKVIRQVSIKAQWVCTFIERKISQFVKRIERCALMRVKGAIEKGCVQNCWQKQKPQGCSFIKMNFYYSSKESSVVLADEMRWRQ